MLAHCQNLPLADRAFLRGHAQLCLRRTPALPAASSACHAGSVPQVTGFAGIHALGERVGIGGDEARSGKFSNRGAEVGGHLTCTWVFDARAVPGRHGVWRGRRRVFDVEGTHEATRVTKARLCAQIE